MSLQVAYLTDKFTFEQNQVFIDRLLETMKNYNCYYDTMHGRITFDFICMIGVEVLIVIGYWHLLVQPKLA